MYSNATIWDLKKEIGRRLCQQKLEDGTVVQETPIHPFNIKLYRMTGSVEIREGDNGKTLGEMKFKPNEIITAQRKMFNQSPAKTPLLDETGETYSPKALEVFKEIFHDYSVDDEETGLRVMTPVKLADLIRVCVGDTCQEDDSRIISLFMEWNKDNDFKLKQGEFLNFYLDSCKSKESTVRRNLMSFGYRSDLRKHVEAEADENMMQPRKRKEDMPRYKMACN